MKTNDRFTRPAQKAIELAHAAASELGHSYVGTEHLLVGLCREEEGLGSRILRKAGLDAAAALSIRVTRMVFCPRWRMAEAMAQICSGVLPAP